MEIIDKGKKAAVFLTRTFEKQFFKMNNSATTKVTINCVEASFSSICLRGGRIQNLNLHQIQHEVKDTYNRDKKIITNFKPFF